MTFGEKLLALRRQAGYSQEELADRLNVSRQAISRWEMGTTLPDAQNLIQLSRIFGVSIDAMLQEELPLTERLTPPEPAAEPSKEEKLRRIAFGVLMGCYAGILCCGLMLWLVWKDFLATLVPVTGHLVGTVVFETVWRGFGASGREWRERYYRLGIWMMAWFPCWHLGRLLWRLYPGAYNSMFPLLTAVILYLAVCFSVRHALQKTVLQ